MENSDGTLRNCIFSVPPVIPARVSLGVDYRTGIVTVALVNVDRLERVTLEFPSTADRGARSRGSRAADFRSRLGILEARADLLGCAVEPRASGQYAVESQTLINLLRGHG